MTTITEFEETTAVAPKQGFREAIGQACSRIAPVWPLDSFVAVNPFLGLSGMKFLDATRLLEKTAHRPNLMGTDYYRRKLQTGEIQAEHIEAALTQCRIALRPEDPVEWLKGWLGQLQRTEQLLTVADRLDRKRGTNWGRFVADEMSKWCASYFDEGQAGWGMPWRDLPLYQAWKAAAEIDANPEMFGLKNFRGFVRALPKSPSAAIAQVMKRLGVSDEVAADFLHRELLSVSGWSAHAAYRDWQSGGTQTVEEVLAIRLAYDGALLALDPLWTPETAEEHGGFTEAKYIAQTAAEYAFRSQLGRGLRPRPEPPQPALKRKELQAVFCIDVRSEVYRRALEAQSGEIATIGFAGFFGMAVQLGNEALCPVLLKPGYKLQQVEAEAPGLATKLWKQLRSSATACFPAVEVTGAGFALGLLGEFLRKGARATGREFKWNIPLAERADLVAGALKNMSLDVAALAPVVLICGHGARTENNPYAASLDCGACGGHSGEVNARLAAALMNDPDTRRELKRRGVEIPEDTVFVPALHETTTEDVILLDRSGLDRSGLGAAKCGQLEGWLGAASARARRERGVADREARRKAADWSEVRPEWGLAGNAAFVAAPRWRTSGLNLGGRVFLHDYDEARDGDNSVLNLILTAPVVVASWINLQYYGSTVNNNLFGSGNKTLHNVVGKFGIWEGNAGDLRTGLPIQSLHDGSKWMHEPLRLQVFIEARRERIEQVLKRNRDIRLLADNEWIQLLAIEGEHLFVRRRNGEWSAENFGTWGGK